MPVFHRKKTRGPYDKIVKHAVELFRQELSPLRTDQQRILAQNEKITEYIRQIWSNLEQNQIPKAP